MTFRPALLAALLSASVLPAQAAEPAALAMTMSALPHGTFVLDRAPELDKGIAAFVAQAPGGQRERLAQRLKDVDPLYKQLELGATAEAFTLRFEGREPLVLPLDGRDVAWTREGGETMRVNARPSLSGVLQTYKAADGERTNEFVQLPDGRLILSVQVHVNGLAKDLSYTVVYRAAK
ncbi:MAG TPA: hypothetical protein VL181_01670 [Holophagaceae bacterium]|nr:hypothetical protein [Holophagaceae bacterium]